jgi:hypothetical protein
MDSTLSIITLTSDTALTEVSCLTDGIQFTKKDSVNAYDEIIITLAQT